MGLRGRLLRTARDCIHTVVSAGCGQGSRRGADQDCEGAWCGLDAGRAGMVIEKVSGDAADSRDVVGGASGGKRSSGGRELERSGISGVEWSGSAGRGREGQLGRWKAHARSLAPRRKRFTGDDRERTGAANSDVRGGETDLRSVTRSQAGEFGMTWGSSFLTNRSLVCTI